MATAYSNDEKGVRLSEERTECQHDENINNEEIACSIESPVDDNSDEGTAGVNDKRTTANVSEGTSCSNDEETTCLKAEATASSTNEEIICANDGKTTSFDDEETARSIVEETTCSNDGQTEHLNDDNTVFTSNEETASSTYGEIVCANDEDTSAGSTTDGETAFSVDNIASLNDEETEPSNDEETAVNDGETACLKVETTVSSTEGEICTSDENATAGSTNGETAGSNDEETAVNLNDGETACLNVEGTVSSTEGEIASANEEDTNAGSTNGETAGSNDATTTSFNDGETECLFDNKLIALVIYSARCPRVERSEPNPAFMEAIMRNLSSLRWESQTHNPFALMPVRANTPEYVYINEVFSASARSYTLRMLQRIENPYLYAQYLLKKEKLQLSRGPVYEKRLFHGTAQFNIKNICETNFDWRKSTAVKFGQGVSFAPEAYYATHYSRDKVMILSQVLVNRSVVGNFATVVPPATYDTTTNWKHTVYVKYEDDDFYPQYVIYYS